MQFLKNANAMFAAIDGMFCFREVESIVLVLGSSPLNIRESFVIKMGYDAGVLDTISDKEANEYSRRLMRTLITSGMDAFRGDLAPTKTYLLAHIAGDSIPDGFIAKHAFMLKTTQVTPLPILLESTVLGLDVRVPDVDTASWDSADLDEHDATSFGWYQIAKPTVGFRLAAAT